MRPPQSVRTVDLFERHLCWADPNRSEGICEAVIEGCEHVGNYGSMVI